MASSRSACAKAGSLCTRAATVSLKSRVSAMSLCSFGGGCLAALVVLPQRHRLVDVLLLALLGAAADQDDDLQTVLAQVDAQPWPPVDLVLPNAAKPLDIGQVALLHSAYRHTHLGGRDGLQRLEPRRKGAVAIGE